MSVIREGHGSMLQAPLQALVNPVNCVGVMGRGLAAQFKHRWPRMFHEHQRACGAGEVRPGSIHIWSTGEPQPEWIFNFPTKRHWRDQSRLEDIHTGLVELGRAVEVLRIRSVGIPALGCGLGGLDWGVVEPAIREAVKGYPVGLTVWLWAPQQSRR